MFETLQEEDWPEWPKEGNCQAACVLFFSAQARETAHVRAATEALQKEIFSSLEENPVRSPRQPQAPSSVSSAVDVGHEQDREHGREGIDYSADSGWLSEGLD